jgi:hypothetical protein
MIVIKAKHGVVLRRYIRVEELGAETTSPGFALKF